MGPKDTGARTITRAAYSVVITAFRLISLVSVYDISLLRGL
jgi:hypothetical protein